MQFSVMFYRKDIKKLSKFFKNERFKQMKPMQHKKMIYM